MFYLRAAKAILAFVLAVWLLVSLYFSTNPLDLGKYFLVAALVFAASIYFGYSSYSALVEARRARFRVSRASDDPRARSIMFDAGFEGGKAVADMPQPWEPSVYRGSLQSKIPADLQPVFERLFAAKGYAEVAEKALRYMVARADVPASPYPAGHRGATLLEHSFNVVRTMVERMPFYQYEGIFSKDGKTALCKPDAPYRFEAHDPLPILAALCHDIGKAVCYVRKNDGWEEALDEHDTRGAAVLCTLGAAKHLPAREAYRLLTAVGYYHKIYSMPDVPWSDDRCRALIDLLYQVDCETGRREEEGEYDDFIAHVVKLQRTAATGAPSAPQPKLQRTAATGAPSAPQPKLQRTAATGAPSAPQPRDEDERDQPAHPPLKAPKQEATPAPSAASTPQADAAAEVAITRASVPPVQAAYDDDVLPVSVSEMAPVPQQERASGGDVHAAVDDARDAALADARPVDEAPRKAASAVPDTSEPQVMQDEPGSLSPEMDDDACVAAYAELLHEYARSTGLHEVSDSDIIGAARLALEPLAQTLAPSAKSNTRIGFKRGRWLYLHEQNLCDALMQRYDELHLSHYGITREHLQPSSTHGTHRAFTRRLMLALAARGALLQHYEADGQTHYFGPKSAYFYVRSKPPADLSGVAIPQNAPLVDASGQNKVSGAHYIVARAWAFGERVFAVEDHKYNPTLLGSPWKPLQPDSAYIRPYRILSARFDADEPRTALEKEAAKEQARLERGKMTAEEVVQVMQKRLGKPKATKATAMAVFPFVKVNGKTCFEKSLLEGTYDIDGLAEIEHKGKVYIAFD